MSSAFSVFGPRFLILCHNCLESAYWPMAGGSPPLNEEQSLNMNGHSMHAFGSLHHGLRDRWMRVHGAAQLFGRRFQLH